MKNVFNVHFSNQRFLHNTYHMRYSRKKTKQKNNPILRTLCEMGMCLGALSICIYCIYVISEFEIEVHEAGQLHCLKQQIDNATVNLIPK